MSLSSEKHASARWKASSMIGTISMIKKTLKRCIKAMVLTGNDVVS